MLNKYIIVSNKYNNSHRCEINAVNKDRNFSVNKVTHIYDIIFITKNYCYWEGWGYELKNGVSDLCTFYN